MAVLSSVLQVSSASRLVTRLIWALRVAISGSEGLDSRRVGISKIGQVADCGREARYAVLSIASRDGFV